MPRVESLDILRGLTIAGMILVNNPGDWSNTWPVLKHASWDGLTLADLVFPFFLFVVGVSVSLSVQAQISAGVPRRSILSKAFIRTLKMVAIGLFLNLLWDWHWDSFRIPGVLQRIAATYLICVLFYLYLTPSVWLIFVVLTTFLAAVLLKWVPSDGGNVYGWVDQFLFGKHVYRPTAPMDAEGFCSGITAVQNGVFGMLTGLGILGLRRVNPVSFSVGLLSAGSLIHLWVLPVNKLLWTPSFAMVTSGLALTLLQVFLLAEPVPAFRQWAEPFRRAGKNAILIYSGSEVLEHIWVGHWFPAFSPRNRFIEWVSGISPFPEWNSLLWALLLVTFFLSMGWYFHRWGIRWKL